MSFCFRGNLQRHFYSGVDNMLAVVSVSGVDSPTGGISSLIVDKSLELS